MVGYRVRYLPATNYRPSRFAVTNLKTGHRRIVGYTFEHDNAAHYAATVANHGGPVEYIGADKRDTFYVAKGLGER